MKNTYIYFILIVLSGFSFYMTHKTVNFLKHKDSLMLSLINNQDKYLKKPINPIIENNTITPGLNGSKINIDKSYNRLKKVGSFNEQLLIYDQIKLKNNLSNNKDKYIISGNPKKNMVSILLYIDDLNDYNLDTSLNYIVNYNLINSSIIKNIIDKGNNLVIYNTNKDKIKSFSKILSKTKQKNNYCFNEKLDNDFLNLCSDNNYYSLHTNVILNNYYTNVKKNLTGGSIIVLKGNYQKELNLIINYIKSKGYTIVNLDTHLNENS